MGGGIGLEKGSFDNEITHNNIFNNDYCGIWLSESNSNLISHNTISDNQYGICLIKSNDNKIIDNNKIIQNSIGVYLAKTYNSEIKNNNILNNKFCGIFLSSANGFKINRNNIAGNGFYGFFELIALLSYGDAAWNYWGVPYKGPWSPRIVRLKVLDILSIVFIEPIEWEPYDIDP